MDMCAYMVHYSFNNGEEGIKDKVDVALWSIHGTCSFDVAYFTGPIDAYSLCVFPFWDCGVLHECFLRFTCEIDGVPHIAASPHKGFILLLSQDPLYSTGAFAYTLNRPIHTRTCFLCTHVHPIALQMPLTIK